MRAFAFFALGVVVVSCSSIDEDGNGPRRSSPDRADASPANPIVDGGSSGQTDTGTPVQPGDPNGRCRLEDPFTGVTKLTTLNSGTLDAIPRLTVDEKVLVFVSANTGATSWDLFRSKRNDVATPFPAPIRLPRVNSDKLDSEPAISPDGKRLYLVSDRIGPDGEFRIFLSTESNVDNEPDFAKELQVGHVNGKKDVGTALSPRGDELFFNSDRNGTNDLLFRVALDLVTGLPLGTPALYEDLDQNGLNSRPVFSPDMLTVYFTSQRAGGKGLGDLWYATRNATIEKFGTPVNVGELNNEFGQNMGWISPDLCRIYWNASTDATDLGGLATADLYVASRAKR